ncbi:carbon-nitrogen hydrolase family protein [Candidatus Pacearchaeota archaeon]|nr:carbon-nitrogen hydrolase family protein [Candidatus Pacearchaeota archaeon]
MLVGAAQINISIGRKKENLSKCLNLLKKAAVQHIELLAFPECTLTGYVFNSYDEAFLMAETIPGDSTNLLKEACHKYKITALVGLLEHDGGKIYNTAVLINPEGLVGKYRKSHTLCLGVDRYILPGEDLPVFSLHQTKVGILICYDQRFPEPARVMALKEAQVILNPANLPQGAEAYPNFLNQARACENRVFIVHANRVGEERNVRFIGRSQIIDYSGRILAEGSSTDEEIIKAQIKPEEANLKHVVNVPGEYEFDVFGDRRPDLYGVIAEPNQNKY